MNIVNPSKLSDGIINIGKLCASYSVKGIIPSILTKHNILTKTIREDNDKLKEKCHLDNFRFICNDNVSRDYLWKDGIQYDNKGTNVQITNIKYKYANSNLTRNNGKKNHTEFTNLSQTCSDDEHE